VAKKKTTEIIEEHETARSKELRQSSLIFVQGLDLEWDEGDGSTMRFYLGRSAPGEGGVELGSALIETTPSGSKKVTIPRLWRPAGVKYQNVCGYTIELRSFTVPERDMVMDLQEDLGLSELIDKNQELALNFIKKLNLGPRRQTLGNLRKQLVKARDDLIAKVGADHKKYNATMKKDLEGIDENLVEIDTTMEGLEGSVETLASKSLEKSKERRMLNQQISDVYLRTVHALLVFREDIDEKEDPFENWVQRAVGVDYDRAVAVLKAGNVGWNSTETPGPLTPEELREMSLNRLLAQTGADSN
jgi:hypothetical protein